MTAGPNRAPRAGDPAPHAQAPRSPASRQPALAETTLTQYRGQWRRFVTWARAQGVRALPAEPAHLAAYLTDRLAREGRQPATLRAAAAAIASIHRAAGLANPCATPDVRQTVRDATRTAGRPPKHAAALTAQALASIQATAAVPRRGRGGHLESRAGARRRACLDVALISLMRDALLGVADAAALTWADLDVQGDGTGRLQIRRAPPAPGGPGSFAFVSLPTMARLAALRHGAGPGDRLFGLGRTQLATRITQAARAAGLGDGFNGRSPRVGMAHDLAQAGLDRPRRRTASPDAVARFYASRRNPA